MYIEHPYFYEGKYYANIDGEMIEITKEVAYAMNNFYRSSKAKKVEIKNELGEVVDKMLREVPYSGQSIDGEVFMIEDFPDLNCDVEHCVLTKMEQQDIHKAVPQEELLYLLLMRSTDTGIRHIHMVQPFSYIP